MLEFTLDKPSSNSSAASEKQSLSFDTGESIVFFGPNGSGKTRLAVYLEKALGPKAHRISALRTLILNDSAPKIKQEDALKLLRYGQYRVGAVSPEAIREGNRWGGGPAVHQLNDFQALIQSLFAEQAQRTLKTHRDAVEQTGAAVVKTKFEDLADIWKKILPSKELLVDGDSINVKDSDGSSYSAASMSDGERSVFYLLGQAIILEDVEVFIFDEPELHLHPTILVPLFDEIEAYRPSCSFIYITHDLSFATSRNGRSIFIKDFEYPDKWLLDDLGAIDFIDESVASLVIGSRRKVLLVEGNENGDDVSILSLVFPEFSVLPAGSCHSVIRSVKAFRDRRELSKAEVFGLIDRDGRSPTQVSGLQSHEIYCQPVSEIENLFLLPDILRLLCELYNFSDDELERKIQEITDKIFDYASDESRKKKVAADATKRRLKAAAVSVSVGSSSDISKISKEFATSVASIQPENVYNTLIKNIEDAVSSRNLENLAKIYDIKSILDCIAAPLNTNKSGLISHIRRSLKNPAGVKLQEKLRSCFPELCQKATH